MNEWINQLLEQIQLPLKNPVLVLSLLLFIILLSPILLKKLNIPGIIGLILSGVVIGPYGLNILDKSSSIDLFSTIGLLYIMFIAGLELNLNDVKSTGNKSLIFGFLTFILPMILGYPVCRYFLNYDEDASFLVASMFSTHTLISYPIISRLGIAKNEAVSVAVGGTILTDTAVLVLLEVIMTHSQGNLNNDFWIKLAVSLTIFAFIMFFIVPKIARWFFKTLESEKHSHYIFVLSVVFFSAFLSQVAGVEPIIGAFVSGLTLNKLIPHSSALMNRIDFIGNALFIPCFLISVGMLVDVSVLLKGPTALIVAVTLTLFALISKWLAAYTTQKIFRYTKYQGRIIFGLSSAHAAATLAVILVGYKAGILDENILNGTIILILITSLVASFVTEKAGKQLAIADDPTGTSIQSQNLSTNEHILLPIDGVNDVNKLLEFSFMIKDKKSSNPITLLNVIPNDEEVENNIRRMRNKFESYEVMASGADAKVNSVVTIDHNIISGIARSSRELVSDMILVEWPKKSALIDKIIGDKIESLLASVDKQIFICDFENPFVKNDRIVVVTPELIEREPSFRNILKKIAAIAQELSLPILFYGNEKTNRIINVENRRKGLGINAEYETFNEWEDFLVLSRSIKDSDLLVVVSARKGSIAYNNILDTIPIKMEKHFIQNNKILIYPQQNNFGPLADNYDDFTGNPLTKGVGFFGKIMEKFMKEKDNAKLYL